MKTPLALIWLRVIAVIFAAAMVAGCAPKKPFRTPPGPFQASFDHTHCHFLPDGIRFQCKDVVFDPQQIDAKQGK
jgi:hypothetical protein